jgi:hypothetical protein
MVCVEAYLNRFIGNQPGRQLQPFLKKPESNRSANRISRGIYPAFILLILITEAA